MILKKTWKLDRAENRKAFSRYTLIDTIYEIKQKKYSSEGCSKHVKHDS